jgi:hypothetical protein
LSGKPVGGARAIRTERYALPPPGCGCYFGPDSDFEIMARPENRQRRCFGKIGEHFLSSIILRLVKYADTNSKKKIGLAVSAGIGAVYHETLHKGAVKSSGARPQIRRNQPKTALTFHNFSQLFTLDL